jgi:hypothetical protein
MQPVTSAATLALGRTALGLGSIAVEGIGAGLEDDGSANVRVKLTTSQDATSQAVTSAFHLTQRIATGPITYTLPRANTLWNGFGFKVENLSSGGNVTFALDSHDSFEGLSSGTSLIIGLGARILLYTDAATSGTWRIEIVGGRTTQGDAAYTITPGDRTVVTNATLTAARTWTLPAANSVPAGTQVTVSDEANGITSTNTLAVSRAGSDTIVAQGTTVNSITLSSAGDSITLISDGSSKWLIKALRKSPTVQRFTSGTSQTYTPATGVARIRVRMVGGGGGGGARATNNGANGTDTSFGSWTAIHGVGGVANGGTGGTGGTGGANGTGTLIFRVDGMAGMTWGAGSTIRISGSSGGSSVFGGAGSGASSTSAGNNAAANSGSGGQGGGGSSSSSGAGGGAGEYVEFWVSNPGPTTYTVGAKGTGGAAGGAAGGDGAAGVIIIEEFYA